MSGRSRSRIVRPAHAFLAREARGKVTFDNGTWYPNDEELTGDDNLSFSIEWPNSLDVTSTSSQAKIRIFR